MNLLLLTLLIIVTVCLAQGLDRELQGNLRRPTESCKVEIVNGLPYSFIGVLPHQSDEPRCDYRYEWEREAHNRCIGAAQTQYGAMAVITFQTGRSPDWGGGYTKWIERRHSNSTVARRKCNAIFNKLNCPSQLNALNCLLSDCLLFRL